jgi:pimeloyl-ACP methyl ester carboxylesterase
MNEVKPEDKYFDIDELRLHYLDWGGHGKQPMLLLHGFMGHAHVWDVFALEFRNHYHVVSLDQRGHGESEWSQGLAYSIDDHFSDICRFAGILGLDRMILIGHSMGGRNALLFAACFPEKIERLMLVDSRPWDSEQSSSALMQLLMHFPLQSDTLEEVVESIRKIYPLLSLEFAHHIARYGYRQAGDGKYVPTYDTRMSLQCQKSNYSADNLCSFVGNISCPTLIVRGERSTFLSKEDAKRIVDCLPKGVLREISHSTHMPAQENPEEFKAVVWEFLRSGQ